MGTVDSVKRFEVEDLAIGMFVSSLDKPACQTPFPMEGFYIKTANDLAELSKHCRYVMVNVAKSNLVKEFSSALQLEVTEIPAAIADPAGFKLKQQNSAPKVIPKRRRGRVKRLLILFVVSLATMYLYFKFGAIF